VKLTVKDRPTPGTSNVNTIVHNRSENIVQVALVVICSPQIPQDGLQARELRLERLGETELSDLDVRHTRKQIFSDLAQKPANASWGVVEPASAWVGCWARWEAVWSSLCRPGAFWEAWSGRVADTVVEVFDAVGIVGGVWVDSEEVAGAFDQVFLILRESWEDVAECVFEGLWVITIVPL
jgi:hypothetical protein